MDARKGISELRQNKTIPGHLETRKLSNNIIMMEPSWKRIELWAALALYCTATAYYLGLVPGDDEPTKLHGVVIIILLGCRFLETEDKTRQPMASPGREEFIKLLKLTFCDYSLRKDRETVLYVADKRHSCGSEGKGGLQAVKNKLAFIDTVISTEISVISSSDKKNGSGGAHISGDSGIWSANHILPQERGAAKRKTFLEARTPRDLDFAACESDMQAGTCKDQQATEQTAVATSSSPSECHSFPLAVAQDRDLGDKQVTEEAVSEDAGREESKQPIVADTTAGCNASSMASQASQSDDPREAYFTDGKCASIHEFQSMDAKNEAASQSSYSTNCDQVWPKHRDISSFMFAELKEATNNFDSVPQKEGGHRIGQGSFGVVYYGCIPSEQLEGQPLEVAVKKLRQVESIKPSQQQLCRKQFPNEIRALSRAFHHNVVQLHGQCSEGPELCLVYEYVPGGTLAQCLSKTRTNVPSWDIRMNIAGGVAKAVNYLHAECRPGLIHRDIKSSNILLDHDWNPKLADFGLSCPVEYAEDPDASFDVTSAVGTKSYMAPEALKGHISPKIDVYAFGMILYELVTGLPPYSPNKKTDLIVYMHELEAEGGDPTVMIDPRACWPTEVAVEVLKLARICTDFDSSKRPSMREVVEMLQSLLDQTQIY